MSTRIRPGQTAFRDGAANTAIERYSYDATGNRTSFANAAGTQPYAYPADSHRLAAVAGQARTYDAVGNTLTDGSGRSYAYSAANRLARVDQGGTTRRHYVYNGKGERVRSHLGADDITTLYDEAGRWLGDYAPDGTPRQQAIWLDDLPVGLLASTSPATTTPPGGGVIIEPPPRPPEPPAPPVPLGNGASLAASATPVQRLHYIQPDHLGTPRAVIDPVRNVAVWTWDLASEAFGNSPPNADPDGDGAAFVLDLRFPGQRYDAVSGLNYNYFRDYEPGVGRYAQSDPIGLVGSLSTYAYAEGSPITFLDENGLSSTRGHHYIPRQVYERYNLPRETRLVFERTTTGPVTHYFDRGHRAYNPAVAAEFERFLNRNNIDPTRMTPDQARQCIDEIRNSDVPEIRNYLDFLKRGGGLFRSPLMLPCGPFCWLLPGAENSAPSRA